MFSGSGKLMSYFGILSREVGAWVELQCSEVIVLTCVNDV
jgi:hypothetical protein